MSQHQVNIKAITAVTHDVVKIVTEKPRGFTFTPGQASKISIKKEAWKNKKRSFTITSLPDNEYLEFIIKTYPSHLGVTNEMLLLKKHEKLILHDVFGAIRYKGEGVFIAGGAGVTPFISIFRNLQLNNTIGNNRLILANKSKADIILEKEFKTLLGENFINILSSEKTDTYAYGLITEEFIKANWNGESKYFYICGPPPMMEAIEKQLAQLHVHKKSIIKESF